VASARNDVVGALAALTAADCRSGTFLGLLGFLKLFFLAYGIRLSPDTPRSPPIRWTSVAHDYNFYALSNACGAIACVCIWRTPRWALWNYRAAWR